MAQQPRHLQIADDLRDRIEVGEIPPGRQLPTESELRDRYEASRNTITADPKTGFGGGEGATYLDAVSENHRVPFQNVPWSLQTSYYPLSFVYEDGATDLLMAQDLKPGIVKYLAGHGHRQIGYRDWITARSPDENEQRFFRISYEVTVSEIFRTAFDQDKVPMRVTVTVCPTDRNQFIVDVGDDLPDPQY